MSDLISRSVLLEDMKKELEKAVNSEDISEDECKVLLTSALALKSFVNRQPTVEALPKEKLQEIVERLEDLKQHNLNEVKKCSEFENFQVYMNDNRGFYRDNAKCYEVAIGVVKEVGGMNG